MNFSQDSIKYYNLFLTFINDSLSFGLYPSNEVQCLLELASSSTMQSRLEDTQLSVDKIKAMVKEEKYCVSTDSEEETEQLLDFGE